MLPESLVDDLGEASPPFNVRDAEEISRTVGPTALPFGFRAVPVLSYEPGNYNDFRTESCPVVDEVYFTANADPDMFKGWEYLADLVRDQIGAAMDFSDELMA